MGYPIFGKVKTIVLPIPLGSDNATSAKEYKEKYGIDLNDLFKVDKGSSYSINLKKHNAIIFIQSDQYNNGTIMPIIGFNSNTAEVPSDSTFELISASSIGDDGKIAKKYGVIISLDDNGGLTINDLAY